MPAVAMDIWARATAKWRGMLVYVLLQASMRVVTSYILAHDPERGIHLFASLAGLSTTIYCLVMQWRLLMSDHDGDENWPPLWS